MAYAPYSEFKVGAAVLTGDGKIFKGANVENASFGATACAERVATFSAVVDGAAKITAMAVVAKYNRPIPPCGLCLQVLSEFGRDATVVMANTDGKCEIRPMRELLPQAFSLF